MKLWMAVWIAMGIMACDGQLAQIEQTDESIIALRNSTQATLASIYSAKDSFVSEGFSFSTMQKMDESAQSHLNNVDAFERLRALPTNKGQDLIEIEENIQESDKDLSLLGAVVVDAKEDNEEAILEKENSVFLQNFPTAQGLEQAKNQIEEVIGELSIENLPSGNIPVHIPEKSWTAFIPNPPPLPEHLNHALAKLESKGSGDFLKDLMAAKAKINGASSVEQLIGEAKDLSNITNIAVVPKAPPAANEIEYLLNASLEDIRKWEWKDANGRVLGNAAAFFISECLNNNGTDYGLNRILDKLNVKLMKVPELFFEARAAQPLPITLVYKAPKISEEAGGLLVLFTYPELLEKAIFSENLTRIDSIVQAMKEILKKMDQSEETLDALIQFLFPDLFAAAEQTKRSAVVKPVGQLLYLSSELNAALANGTDRKVLEEIVKRLTSLKNTTLVSILVSALTKQ